MLWAVLKGILNHFGRDLCSIVGIGKEITNAAMMMMDLGDINSAQRFLRLVLRRSRDRHPCFCNNVLLQYVEEGAREMRGKSLRKLSARSVFQPTQALIAHAVSNDAMERLTNVLPSLPMVRFISMADAFPTQAMKFLAAFPPTVQVVSARSHLVGATGRTAPASFFFCIHPRPKVNACLTYSNMFSRLV